MRLLSILAILSLSACGASTTVSTPPAADGAAPEFLTCPDKPGRQYRPGFENTTCKDR